MDELALGRTIQLLKPLVGVFRELLAHVRQGHNFLNLPEMVFPLLMKDGLPRWASLYEDPLRLRGLWVKALIGQKESIDLAEQLKGLSQMDILQIRESFKDELLSVGDLSTEFDDVTLMSLEEAKASWESMTPIEQSESQVCLFLMLYSLVTQLHYYFALMSFGRSICDLVARAKDGDDVAFCQAVQIDKTTLTDIPYFRKRLLRAQLGSEPQFLSDLATAIKGPVLRRKLSYPLLIFVFAALDDEKFLGMPLDRLMDICEEVGVYGREFGVEDIDSLRKRRQYYWRRTGRQNRI